MVENFSGNDTTNPVTFSMPSLYRGGGASGKTPLYWSSLAEAWEIDSNAAGQQFGFSEGAGDNDESGANDEKAYDKAYCVNWDGYGRVVRYELNPSYSSTWSHVRPTSGSGTRTTWGDDPNYNLAYWNYAYALSIGKPEYFIKELIHDFNEGASGLSTADAGINKDVEKELESAKMTTENTFFDIIRYTDYSKSEVINPISGVRELLASSVPHFSTAGGSASGQVGRL